MCSEFAYQLGRFTGSSANLSMVGSADELNQHSSSGQVKSHPIRRPGRCARARIWSR